MIRFFISFCCFLSVVLAFSYAHAQKREKFSSAEDIAIAFYKSGRVVPNFKRWIEKRPPYKLTSPTRRPKVMEEEMLRLQTAYQQFNPSQDYLMIRTFVQLEPKENIDEEGVTSYELKMTFDKASEALYFPYEFLSERIVVMPAKLDKLMVSEINKYQYDMISEETRNSAVNMMVARLRVRKADLSRPYNIDGIEQWALTTDVVSLEVWSKQNRLLWEHSAPWYVSPHTKAINNLYDIRPSQSPSIGAIKPIQ